MDTKKKNLSSTKKELLKKERNNSETRKITYSDMERVIEFLTSQRPKERKIPLNYAYSLLEKFRKPKSNKTKAHIKKESLKTSYDIMRSKNIETTQAKHYPKTKISNGLLPSMPSNDLLDSKLRLPGSYGHGKAR